MSEHEEIEFQTKDGCKSTCNTTRWGLMICFLSLTILIVVIGMGMASSTAASKEARDAKDCFNEMDKALESHEARQAEKEKSTEGTLERIESAIKSMQQDIHELLKRD